MRCRQRDEQFLVGDGNIGGVIGEAACAKGKVDGAPGNGSGLLGGVKFGQA